MLLCTGHSATYRLAGRCVTLEHELPELALFQISDFRTLDVQVAAPRPRRIPEATPYSFERTVFVAGALQRVQCTWTDSGCRLRLKGLGEIRIDCSGTLVGWSYGHVATADDRRLLRAAVVEFGLVLALALQGVWCLRASAIERETPEYADASEAMLFLDDGLKPRVLAATVAALSQDARFLARWRGRRLRLAADSIVPWTLEPTPRVLPRFPQLGHPPHRQPASLVSRDVPMAAIYCLAPASEASRETAAGLGEAELVPMKPQEAVLRLISRSAGSILFSQGLLARQFDDLTAAVGWTRVHRLRVAERPNAASQILRIVASNREEPSPQLLRLATAASAKSSVQKGARPWPTSSTPRGPLP